MFCALMPREGRGGPPAVSSSLHRLTTKTLVTKMHDEQKRLRRVTSALCL